MTVSDSFNGLPTLTNISFEYDLGSGNFIFLDKSMSAFFNADDVITTDLIISRINPDDVVILKQTFPLIVSGQFKGNLRFRIGNAGKEYWVSVTPFLNKAAGTTIYGNVIDITSEIENYNFVNKYANKKNSVLYMLAHDLRGPLNVANSLVKILDRDISDPVALNKTHSISAIIQEAIDLISDLTKREFLESVEVILSKKRINIVQKLKDYINECKLSSHLAGRSFSFFSDQQSVFLNVDESKFMQVVNNLISNALKFTRDGGVITVTVKELSDAVHIIFTDDGIGIPAALVPLIFDKFTTAGRTGLNGEQTVGLGLSIAKTVMDWHDGKIWCESEVEKGCRFTLELPKSSNEMPQT